MGALYEGILQLDPSAQPRRLDMKFDTGPEKGHTNFCIYELQQDVWTLCIATRGAARPTEFGAPEGAGLALETLTRGAAAGAAAPEETPAASAGATELEGEWSMVSAVMDGHPMEDSAVVWVRRVTQGRRTTVYAGPQVMLKVDFSHNPRQSPKTLDYLNIAGPQKGKTQLGIYELEGARLTVCVGAPGEPRPERFHSAPGDGATLTVWQRK
jgi:uncharacterized protein (TIGR03067 family)